MKYSLEVGVLPGVNTKSSKRVELVGIATLYIIFTLTDTNWCQFSSKLQGTYYPYPILRNIKIIFRGKAGSNPVVLRS